MIEHGFCLDIPRLLREIYGRACEYLQDCVPCDTHSNQKDQVQGLAFSKDWYISA